MADPSWRQLARIPESSLKAEVLRAAGIEPPPEAISREFHMPVTGTITHTTGTGFVWYHDRSSRFVDGSELLRLTHAHPGTPTGDALRAWLRRWGWIPKSER